MKNYKCQAFQCSTLTHNTILNKLIPSAQGDAANANGAETAA